MKKMLSSGTLRKILTGAGLCSLTLAVQAQALTARIGAYPGNVNTHASGNISVTFTDNYLTMFYELQGVKPVTSGGVHIHTGTSCDNASDVGGHYWAPVEEGDYWKSARWVADSAGDAKGSFRLVSGIDYSGNKGHAVVIHDDTGSRIGCGILN